MLLSVFPDTVSEYIHGPGMHTVSLIQHIPGPGMPRARTQPPKNRIES
jgi:hypothetical protein